MAAWAVPSPGDIVWCHFPELPRREPGPKPRPALVLRVDEHEDGVAVEVAYGTSKRTTHLRAGEFAIRDDDGDAYRLAGLACDTKFDLGAKLLLPWNEAFFKVPPGSPCGQTPKLGTLHASLMRRAVAANRAVEGH